MPYLLRFGRQITCTDEHQQLLISICSNFPSEIFRLINEFLRQYLYSPFIMYSLRIMDIENIDILFTRKYLITKIEGDFGIETQVIDLYTKKVTEFSCIFSLEHDDSLYELNATHNDSLYELNATHNYETEITKYTDSECEIHSTEAPVVPETYQYITEGKGIPNPCLHSVRGSNKLLIVDERGHIHLYY